MKKAFTFVELMVVVSMLAILSTIAFVSLAGYNRQARDGKRFTDVGFIVSKIELENSAGTPLSDLIINANPIELIINLNDQTGNIGIANFLLLKEDGYRYKDPSDTSIDYPVAYVQGGIGEDKYSFFQVATISEVFQTTRLFGDYYKLEEGDSPSLFSPRYGEAITDGGSKMIYVPNSSVDFGYIGKD